MRRVWQSSVHLKALMQLMKSINEPLQCVDHHVMKPIIVASTNLELQFALLFTQAL
jgi:hypothetical protein